MKRSTNVIVSNLSGDKILFSGLFLLLRKKLGGTGAPGSPLATALSVVVVVVTRGDGGVTTSKMANVWILYRTNTTVLGNPARPP